MLIVFSYYKNLGTETSQTPFTLFNYLIPPLFDLTQASES